MACAANETLVASEMTRAADSLTREPEWYLVLVATVIRFADTPPHDSACSPVESRGFTKSSRAPGTSS
jgi:hypothetical protein